MQTSRFAFSWRDYAMGYGAIDPTKDYSEEDIKSRYIKTEDAKRKADDSIEKIC